jgi:DNA-binding PadR family transcriptional regulator
VTQVEQILYELDKAGEKGLLSAEIRERTDIPPGTLRTTTFTLRKEGLIRRASGTRGTYRYAITQKGRTELHARQPLVAHGASPELSKHEEDLENFLRLRDRMAEYQSIRRFISYLEFESPLDLSEGVTRKQLEAELLRFMDVDPSSISRQLADLDTLVSIVRDIV